MHKLVAVIPCLNEEKNIASVIAGLKQHNVIAIVVDDGSIDNTSRIAEKMGAIVIRHRRNKGVGAAIKTGYLFARSMCDDENVIVLVLGGDGQHDTSEIPKLIEPILDSGADYVVGERFSSNPLKFGMPPINFVFGKLLNFFTSIITGIKVRDSTSGFTAIKISALRSLELRFPERAGETHEMLLECARNKIKVKFVSITPIYGTISRISKWSFLKSISTVYLNYLISWNRRD